jgi:outer membrane protein OmpA-like peptidoglycan-associated protein
MNTFESYEPRSNFGMMVGVAFAVAAALGTGVFFLIGSPKGEPSAGPVQEPEPIVESEPFEAPPAPVNEDPKPLDPFDAEPEPPKVADDRMPPPTPEELLVAAGMGLMEFDPEVLVRKIGASLEKSDVKQATTLIGRKALDEAQLAGLQALAAKGDFRLHAVNPVMEIGELEANRRTRWVLNLEGPDPSRIYFDLLRGKSGTWGVDQITLPGGDLQGGVLIDALGITHAFLQAALKQEFDDAKSFVDSARVSDAKIAGLCIIFEEARYQLRPRKPLQAMFHRELTAAFIAHVQDETGEKAADVGVNLQRASTDLPWRVTEVNLESLLADYADRVAGGDVHYTPLVKNPQGGDTLILYFGFDEDGLTPRTKRQLEIVSGLLKIDPGKKLTLSGHTDSLGTDEYNHGLSARRAGAVERYLLETGVPVSQIVSMAEGEAKPRRPNSTADGQDNPSGRRANRRTEIYLDF